MDNYSIADQFSLLSKLMDIHGENSFKARSYGAAAFNIEKLPTPLEQIPTEEIASLKGIGASTAQKIIEILQTGKMQALEEMILNTPPGVIEMLQIKGLGPKKIATIWKEMEIESIGELLYACHENRLSRFKGFGEKTQDNIRSSIEFYQQHQDRFLYADVAAVMPGILSYLEKSFGKDAIQLTGAFRQQDLIIDTLEFVIRGEMKDVKPKFQTAQPPEILEESASHIIYKLKNGLKLHLHVTTAPLLETVFRTSGTTEFVETFFQQFPKAVHELSSINSEEELFGKAGIPYIAPCLRNRASIIEQAKNNALPQLITEQDIRGIIHSHSTWSDGVHSIEEMVKGCLDRKLEYLVISDHSKAAAYAGGLSEERIRQQHEEIEKLNAKYAPFRIFKSIECDILGDGSLDYSDNILSTFDLVIASIHSNLKMSEEKAMSRLERAIQNPYTTILGHMTGRLLLSRAGYPVNHPRIIDLCAEHRVVIELNAHPRRLDIDWSHISYALDKGVLISINPDAHAVEGFDDCKYGVLAAQKAGVTAGANLSSYSLGQFEQFLRNCK